MSEIELLLMEKLSAKATPADTDTMIVAEGNVLKKSTISQLITFLKEKLGVNAINTKLSGKYVLARVDTVAMSAGSLAADTISNTVSATFEKAADDAVCIPICVDSGWSVCTKYWIDDNKLYAQFGCWSGSHSAGGRFNVLQFVKVS